MMRNPDKSVVRTISILVILFYTSITFPAEKFSSPPEVVSGAEWTFVNKSEIIKISKTLLAKPDLPVKSKEVIHRIKALGMDWDIAASIYEPEDVTKIPVGLDGKKIGLFILHGGGGDHRDKNAFAHMLASKFGYRVVNMSYPGRLNFNAENRDWPGDTINPDGSVRTPIYLQGENITPDQYDVIEDKEDSRRRRWGTLILACAKKGTVFYDRMASWPVAHEEGVQELIRRYLPANEFSVYIHGHSTGGPMSMMVSQHVPNIVGIIGMESSPFGAMYGKMTREIQGIAEPWGMDFNCLRVRSWRDTARYYGYELIQDEGVDALARLAMVMEEVFEASRKGLTSALFKAENILHFDNPEQMEAAARASAERLGMNSEDTETLVNRYLGYLRGVSGPGTRPVPPMILIISKNSRDHDSKIYREIYLPVYASMKPAPKIKLYEFEAGKHGYSAKEEGLPLGIAPAGIQLWYDAIMEGYYLPQN